MGLGMGFGTGWERFEALSGDGEVEGLFDSRYVDRRVIRTLRSLGKGIFSISCFNSCQNTEKLHLCINSDDARKICSSKRQIVLLKPYKPIYSLIIAL